MFCLHTRRSPCLSSLGKYQLQAGMASQECVHFNLLTPSFIFLKLHHCGIKMFEQKAKTEHEDVVLVVLLYKLFLVPSTNNLLLFADLETGKASPKQNGSKWHIQPLLYMQISWARSRHNSHDCLWGRSCPTWNWYFPHTFWNFGRLLHVRDWDGVLRKDSSRGAWSSPDWLHCS